MQLNTQVRISAKKLALLHQLFSHRIQGRVTAARLIGEAITEVFNSAKRKPSDLKFFTTDEEAARYLTSKGFVTAQFEVTFSTTQSQTSPKLDLSSALDKVLKEREDQDD